MADAARESDRTFRDIDEPTWTGLRRFPVGVGLLTAGAGTIIGMFAFPEQPVLPVAVGIGIGIVEFAFFSFLYGRSE